VTRKLISMWEALNNAQDAALYTRFLKQRSAAEGDHGILLAAIRSSNLGEPYRAVLTDLIAGKLKRTKHRPHKKDQDMRQLHRALTVLDLEQFGDWKSKNSREAAVTKAAENLRCAPRTVQNALSEFEDLLRMADADFLAMVRAFKS